MCSMYILVFVEGQEYVTVADVLTKERGFLSCVHIILEVFHGSVQGNQNNQKKSF